MKNKLCAVKNPEKDSKDNQKLYIKILIPVTLSVFFTIIILTLLMDVYFERIIINKIFEFEKNNLNQASFSIKLMQDLSRSIATQVYQDNLLKKILLSSLKENTEDNLEDTPLEIYHALNNLEKYTRLIPYIHSIYIYNPVNATFYISSPVRAEMVQPINTFFDKEIINIMVDPKNYNSNIPIPRVIYDPLFKEMTYGVYSFVYELTGTKNFRKSGLIIINISESWMRDIIDAFDTNPRIQSTIIDYTDKLLIRYQDKTMLSQSGIFPYVIRSLKFGNNTDYTIITLENQKILLVYSIIEHLNWIFVKKIPYNIINSEVTAIRKNLFFIAVFILLTGLTSTYLLFKNSYKPIDAIIKKLKFLEEKKKDNLFILKQYYLQQVLKEPERIKNPEFNKIIDEIGFKLHKNTYFSIFLIIIDCYKEWQGKYTIQEQELLHLGILHHASQVVNSYRNEEIVLSYNHLALLLNIDTPDEEKYKNEMLIFSKAIQQVVRANFNISISTVVSPLAGSIEQIPVLYDKLLQMAEYRFIEGYQCCIIKEEIILKNKNPFEYPVKKEAEWIDALTRGNKKKIIILFDEIIDSAKKHSYTALMTTIHNLSYTINKIINNLNEHSFLNFSFNLSDFLAGITKAEILEEINHLFYQLFDQLLLNFSRKMGSSISRLLKQILETIHSDYRNINLSIALLADKYNISAAYLGRIFHKYTGKSMPDFINEVRINKARELLFNQKYSIRDIIHLTGFTNNTHFFRMFKKYMGVTPREYRNKLLYQ